MMGFSVVDFALLVSFTGAFKVAEMSKSVFPMFSIKAGTSAAGRMFP